MLPLKRSTIVSIIAGSLLVGAGGPAVKTASAKWVFTQESIAARIEAQTGFRFQAAAFRTTWFPPGFVAEDVRLYDLSSHTKHPIVQAKNITLKGSYSGILRQPHKIAYVRVQGATFSVPQIGSAGAGRRFNPKAGGFSDGGKMKLALDALVIENSTLEIPQEQDTEPVRFAVERLEMGNLGEGRPIPFSVAMTNPRPQGVIHSRGAIGPWNRAEVFATPVSGTFTFEHADLTVPKAISGFLNAQGKFQGPLRSIECSGSADVPDFLVHGSSHPAHVAASFKGVVDARNGDTALREVTAHFLRTTIRGSGVIQGLPDIPGKKTTELQLTSTDGLVQDLLSLFTKRDPGMQGAIQFNARFRIPPGEPDFLTRLAAEGDFKISGAQFTNTKTQAAINRLSGSAEGEVKKELIANPPQVRGYLQGHVSDGSGLARLRNVQFEAPGIRGQVEGTFDLHSKAVKMAGAVETKGKLSDTVTGGKALLAKVASKLLKKHAAETTVPFRIEGVAPNPVFRLKF